MKLLFGAAAAGRGSLCVAVSLLVGALACTGPTPNRKRRDASDISQTGGNGFETGGTGGFGTGGFGTGGFGTGGRGTGGTGGTGGSGQKFDAAITPDASADADIDAAVVPPDAAADLAADVTPDAGIDAADDAAVVPPDVAPDLAPDLAPDVAADLGVDASPEQQGLVGYWKFDEASGTSAFDSTISENTGTLTNGAIFSTNAHFPNPGFADPGGVVLDGVNDYLSFGTTGIPNLSTSISVSLWVNYGNLTGTHGFISLFNPVAPGCGLQLGIRDGDLRAWKWGGITLATRAAPPASGWHNVIYTFDGTTHTLIVDGVTAGSTTTAQASCAISSVLVGAVQVGLEHFAGSVDDLRIYNRVLSATEIALISGGADPLAGPKLDAGPDVGPTIDLTTGRVGYWKLDEGAGTTTADSSGSGNNGTISGTPTWPTGFPAAQFSNPHALALPGNPAQVIMSGVANLPTINGAKSISVWVNYAAPASGNKTFFSMTNRSMACGLQFGTRTTNGNTNVAIWPWGAATIFAQAPSPAAGWHHMAFTWDGTTNTLYIDGVAVNTSTNPPQSCAPTDAIIGNYQGGNEYYTGTIDDVRVWKDRALTQTEISALFAGQ